jgi:predicted RNase H-like nuclease
VLAGVDGCRGGWVAALEEARGSPLLRFCSLAELRAEVAVIDIPIGLPSAGPRECDLAARRLLGRPRSSSVFPAPTRKLLSAEAPRCSRQLLNIFDKIREADSVFGPARQGGWMEGHPEVSFALMAGGRGLVAPKRTPEGRAERLALLARCFPDLPGELDCDAVDAYALLWTARRVRAGTEERLPGWLELDERGLRMEIVA